MDKKTWFFRGCWFLLGCLVTIVTTAWLGNPLAGRTLVLPGGAGVISKAEIVGKIFSNAPVPQPVQTALQARVRAEIKTITITKDRIVYVEAPNGDRTWTADLAKELPPESQAGGEIGFHLPADGDYKFTFNFWLEASIYAVEGAGGIWNGTTDNPLVHIKKLDVKQLPRKDNAFGLLIGAGMQGGKPAGIFAPSYKGISAWTVASPGAWSVGAAWCTRF